MVWMASPGGGRHSSPTALKRMCKVVMATALVVAAIGWTSSSVAMSMKGRKGWSPTCIPLNVKKPKPYRPPTEEDLLLKDTEQEIIACGDAGDWARALEILDHMRETGMPMKMRVWHAALASCTEDGKLDLVKDLLGTMEKARSVPDHGAYHAAIETCTSLEDADQAQKFFLEMAMRGLEPQLETYAKMLRLYKKAGKMKEARRMYKSASSQAMLDVWVYRGRSLDLRDVPLEVAELLVRFAVEERSDDVAAQGKAGKGGFYVLTGHASKGTAFKQQAVIRVLREEFGLKVRVDPARYGRIRVRGMELKRVGEERQRERVMRG